MRYGQFKIIWFPLSWHHSNRTISLSYYSQLTNENVLKYIYPLKEIVSLSRGPRDHESQGDNFESLGHCWYYLQFFINNVYAKMSILMYVLSIPNSLSLLFMPFCPFLGIIVHIFMHIPSPFTWTLELFIII